MRTLIVLGTLLLAPVSTMASEPFDADMCGDIRSGVFSMLAVAEQSWKVTRETPDKADDETYEQIYFWSQQAANYAQVYETFCKGRGIN